MKLLIVGASGMIGGEILKQSIQHSEITSIIAFSRKPLAGDVALDGKVRTVLKRDFATWNKEELNIAVEGDAMVWAMGTSDTNVDVNYNYALAFEQAFLQAVKAGNVKRRRATPFRFILLSGALVEKDPSKPLYFLDGARKLKGRTELRAAQIYEENKDIWELFIIRPGGVVPPASVLLSWLPTVIGTAWFIRAEEVGAYTADLAVNGGKDIFHESKAIALRGRELLEAGR